MEHGSAAEADSKALLKLFLNRSRLQEEHNEQGLHVSLCEFWGGDRPPLLKDWTNSNMQSCDSPLVSDSSSSLSSTKDSPLFSWSEGSYNEVRQVPHSPEPLSSRFSGFSLFNSGVKHMEGACRDSSSGVLSASRDEKQDGHALANEIDLSGKSACACDVDIDDSRPPDFECDTEDSNESGLRDEDRDHLDGDWARNTAEEADWVSDTRDLGSSSQELDSSAMAMEESVVVAAHQQSNASHLEDWHKGHGIQGLGASVKVESVARPPHGSHAHSLSSSPNIVIEHSLQPNDVRRPFSRRKTSCSAAVKERFAASTMHGYLRFAEQGGSLCYSFFLDDSDEVIFARASRQERKSNKENSDWTYSFHSKKDHGKARSAWKSWHRKENLASDLVANMRVSGLCHLKAKSNQDGRTKEVRFVLYDGGGQHQTESQRADVHNKMRGQPLRPVSDNTSSSQEGRSKDGTKPCLTNLEAKVGGVKIGLLPVGSINRSNPLEAAKEVPRIQEFKLKPSHSQQAELAAIIINTSLKEKKISKKTEKHVAQNDAAGWGVKFLEKGIQRGWGLSLMEKSSSNPRAPEETAPCRASSPLPGCFMAGLSSGAACQSLQVKPSDDKDAKASNSCPDLAPKLAKKMNTWKNRLKVDVTVILPAGDHGLLDDDKDNMPGQYGPTPLLERWMSGGDCDCGGWDLGCGLSVFKAETLSLRRRTSSIALTRNDCINWVSPGNPFKLLSQGYRSKKVLVLEIVEAGLFSLSFQARVSPLQAFAISVALFHQQMMVDK